MNCINNYYFLFMSVEGDYKIFYILKIKAMSVGSNKFNFPRSSPFGTNGNIIIDSGTTLTFLQPDIFASFSQAISEVMDLKSTTSPIETLEYCYESTTDDYKVPPVTAHFKVGDVNLKRENLFIRVADDVVCLVFVGNNGKNNMQIYGNVAHRLTSWLAMISKNRLFLSSQQIVLPRDYHVVVIMIFYCLNDLRSSFYRLKYFSRLISINLLKKKRYI